MGYTDIIIEGCGPLGLSSGGVPNYEAFEPDMPPELVEEAWQMLERIIGREYGLYRYVIDTILDPAGYFRALASKGQISPQYLDILERLDDCQIRQISRANQDYLRVVDKMEKRRLIGSGDSWLGVLWTNRNSAEEVLFACEDFTYSLAGGMSVEDITEGTIMDLSGDLHAEAMHTYIIGGSAGAGSSPRPIDFSLRQNFPNTDFSPAFEAKRPRWF